MSGKWHEALQRVVSGRPVLLAGAQPAPWNDIVPLMQAAGATRILIYSPNGVGLLEGPDVPVVSVDAVVGLTPTETLRRTTQLLNDPPPNIVDEIDAFDPERQAVVFATFVSEAATVAGRPCVAYRRPEWVRLEDKLLADEIWDAAGVARHRSVIVDLADAATASRSIDENWGHGAGTVWAADASHGLNGGGDGIRWVTNPAEAAQAVDELGAFARRVRIMPFVEGIPCSIHGMVMGKGTVALRPVEMITLRHDHRFVYRGCASYWDPTDSTREQMRTAAKKVGEVLRTRVDFRGVFTIDGVAGEDGFWPTELNPRFGSGMFSFDAFEGPPLTLVNDLVVAGAVDLTAAEFEGEILPMIDARRGGATWGAQASPSLESLVEIDLAWSDDRWVGVDHVADTPVSAQAWVGPHMTRCVFNPDNTPKGPSVAPRAAALWNDVVPEFGGPSPHLVPAGGYSRR